MTDGVRITNGDLSENLGYIKGKIEELQLGLSKISVKLDEYNATQIELMTNVKYLLSRDKFLLRYSENSSLSNRNLVNGIIIAIIALALGIFSSKFFR